MTARAPLVEFIHLGTDAGFDILFEEDNQAVDLSSVTRIRVEWIQAGYNIDSATQGSAFDWVTQGAAGIATFRFGQITPPPPKGCWPVKLTVFDAGAPAGLPWASTAPEFPQQLTLCTIEG